MTVHSLPNIQQQPTPYDKITGTNDTNFNELQSPKNEEINIKPLTSLQTEIKLIPAKLVYFFFGLGQSQIKVYLHIYYEKEKQFNYSEIGRLGAIPGLCAILGPPIWGIIGDAFRRQRLVHNICVLIAALSMFSLGLINDYKTMYMAAFIAYFHTASSFSLLDQAVLILVAKLGNTEYGKQRMGKALGSLLGTIITGTLINIYSMKLFFYFYLGYILVSLIALQFIPSPDKKNDKDKNQDELEIIEKDEPIISTNENYKKHLSEFLLQMKCLFKRIDLIVLMILAIVFGTLHGSQTTFLYLSLGSRAKKENADMNSLPLVIATSAIEYISELPCFYFSGLLIRRFGIIKILLLGASCYAIRFGYYSMMSNEWYSLPFSALQGITFSLTWAALAEYVYAASPEGAVGTSIGLLNMFYNGFGRMFGSLIGGYLSHNSDFRFMWKWSLIVGVPIAYVAVALLAFTMKYNSNIKNSDFYALTRDNNDSLKEEKEKTISLKNAVEQNFFNKKKNTE